MIYYIVCTETNRMKIGYTKGEPEVRLKQLQTGSASDLRLAAHHDGSIDFERALHEHFASDRVRGEWFVISDPILLHLSVVFDVEATKLAASGERPPEWLRRGLQAMRYNEHRMLPRRALCEL